MTAFVSSLILTGVFGAVAACGTGLVIALYRAAGRRQAD